MRTLRPGCSIEFNPLGETGPRAPVPITARSQPHPRVADPGDQPPPSPVAALRDIAVTIGGAPILANIDLELRSSEVVGLVGPNGAGKTTLLRVLATLQPIASGEGRVLGVGLHGEVPGAVRRRIVYLGHEPALHPSLSLRENLHLLAGRWRTDAEVDDVLDAVGLGAAGDRRATDCSRGMVRRAEMARALLLEPRLLLLDEAHAGLDLASSGLVSLLLDDVHGAGGAAVVVSHDHGRLEPLVDRLVRLEAGRIVGAGA